MKLWDFAGMDGASCKPFKSLVEPCGGNPIRDVQFSCSGDQFLIATGSAQAKLFDRDGNEM